jgi:hypothetical protein
MTPLTIAGITTDLTQVRKLKKIKVSPRRMLFCTPEETHQGENQSNAATTKSRPHLFQFVGCMAYKEGDRDLKLSYYARFRAFFPQAINTNTNVTPQHC